jgi:16S rRNA (guanine527-N7)-methyltransferase
MGHASLDTLVAYLDLLVKWNKKINLTSLDIDPLTDAAIDRLLVEPVKAAEFVSDAEASVIDLGSGGGSPAIPIKIQLPKSKLRMVESRSRKCAFLREASRHLGLSDTSVEESRFEQLHERVSLKSSADIVTIRAVRLDAELVKLVRWLLVPGGRVFRFSNTADEQLPRQFQLVSSHGLVASFQSQLQIIELAK